MMTELEKTKRKVLLSWHKDIIETVKSEVSWVHKSNIKWLYKNGDNARAPDHNYQSFIPDHIQKFRHFLANLILQQIWSTFSIYLSYLQTEFLKVQIGRIGPKLSIWQTWGGKLEFQR